MPPRHWKLRVADILDAISAIRQYTAGMDYDAFSADSKTVDAVIRNITVIGEAARCIPSDIVDATPAIPWKDMREMRNIVVHAYFGVNRRILWDTIQMDLSPLVPLLEELRRQNEGDTQ
ncbi:MAG: DUF86 domain-containing protein [Planctomycetes bacterium]|nr:DUF86 domain-containing protein [Planctomycetota bacterium]